MPARRNRVTQGSDYRHIVRRGNRVGGAYCITHAVFDVADTVLHPGNPGEPEGGRPARYGFIISKAVGNAVTRNLIRRRLKTIVDQRIAQGETDIDVVFRALPASAEASFPVLEQEVNASLDRLVRKRAAQLKANSVRSE